MGEVVINVSDLIIIGLMATVVTMLITAVVEYVLIINEGLQKFFLTLMKVGAIIFWPTVLYILLFM